MKNDRRTFLKQVGGAAAAAMAVSGLTEEAAAQQAVAITPSAGTASYGQGRFILVLEGAQAGLLTGFEGGNAVATVVTEAFGTNPVQKKHISGVQFEDIVLECTYGMSNAFYNWIKAFLQRKAPQKNGSIIFVDYNWREISRLEFTNALITEVIFPELDASSKEQGKMTVRLTPEYTKNNRKGANQQIASISNIQKRWLPANFRLQIDGMDGSTNRVSKIDALSIKQAVNQDPIGEVRDPVLRAGPLDIPNLAITISETGSDSILQWFDDFVMKGMSTDDKEKTGTLEMLSNDLKTVLFTLKFSHLGIFKCAPEKSETGGAIRRIKAEMYCEDIAFDYTPAWKS